MDIEVRNRQIERYLDDAETDFDRILTAGERNRRHRTVRRAGLLCAAVAAGVALLLWLSPVHPSSDKVLTPVQIAEGIQQMMLLDIGEIESIEAIPADSYAILTARLKNGNTCSYILRCNDVDGSAILLAYADN